MNIRSYFSEFKQILRYLLVGGMSAFVDLAVSFVLFYAVGINNFQSIICYLSEDCTGSFFYDKFEECVSSISFFAGFIFSYLGHAKYTFKTGTSKQTLLRLFALALVNVCLRAVIISIEKQFGLSGYISIVISLIIVTVFSYIASKFWVFRTNSR